tara:strand:- start:908 stop:1228 length:321 start_codon:yes stop_codon:yes gene_type:complete
MATVIKEGDLTAGIESGYPPTFVAPGTSTGTANSVFIGGIGVVCQGDFFTAHTNNSIPSTHVPVAGMSGTKVFVGPAKKEVFTNITSMNPGCSDLMAPVIGTVNAG